MLKIIYSFLILFFAHISYSQGTQNDFPFDDEDLNFLFNELGYSVFKFPVLQHKEEIFDIVAEEYRDGVLDTTFSLISITEEAFKGIDIDVKRYLTPKLKKDQTDSVYFHRFYSERKDSLLTIFVKSHGLKTPFNFDIGDLAIGSVRARFQTKEEIDSLGYLDINDEEMLLYFYANKKGNDMLWCPAGLGKDKVAK